MKTYSDSVLIKQTKAELIDDIRSLENELRESELQIEQQAKNCVQLLQIYKKAMQWLIETSGADVCTHCTQSLDCEINYMYKKEANCVGGVLAYFESL